MQKCKEHGLQKTKYLSQCMLFVVSDLWLQAEEGAQISSALRAPPVGK